MMAEQMPPEAKSPVSLFATPGIRTFATPNLGKGRGLHVRRNRLYALCGDQYVRIDGGGQVTTLGTIHGDTRGYFANNGTQTVIVSDGVGFVESNNVVTPITDPDFLIRHVGPCGLIDSYVMFIDIGSQQFIGSALGDATNYAALDYSSADGAPDNLIGLIVDHRQVFLMGQTSCELWYDDGGSGFPFSRNAGGFIEIGCLAPRSAVKADNSIWWLANDLTFRRLSGNTGVRVSHHGVEQALAGYANPADCEGLTFTHEGHVQVAFNFITDNATWVYDITTQEWHERDSFPGLVWRGVDAVSLNGKTYVQDRITGSVGILDSTVATEWGSSVRREWTYGSVYHNNLRVSHNMLEVIMQAGVGTITGGDPKILLQWSDDGGQKWHNGEDNSLGLYGQSKARITSESLGESRDRVYRRVITDPVMVRVLDSQLDYTLGSN